MPCGELFDLDICSYKAAQSIHMKYFEDQMILISDVTQVLKSEFRFIYSSMTSSPSFSEFGLKVSDTQRESRLI